MLLRQTTIALALTLCFFAHAQQEQKPIGSISTRDALVTGGLQVQGEQAKLLTAASVTAYNRTAPIELSRGGNVLVCSTSRFHILRSGNESALIFAIDRGAIEIHSDSQLHDVVMTPDMRITFASAGPLDLRLRVTSNGDTCVENTGKRSPELAVSDAFSDTNYHVRPGQHVLFEHGSVREVVDQERSPCGCPSDVSLPTHLAENQESTATKAASARNPFPAAVSQGLAPEPKPIVTAPKQVSESDDSSADTVSYTSKPEPAVAAIPPTTTSSVQETSLAPPASPPGVHDLAHAIGRFFHRLFHRRSGRSSPESSAKSLSYNQ